MDLERYHRQILLPEIGLQHQEMLSKKHIVIIGGGGLGSNSADILIRCGVGFVDIIDYDVVDITNLHRTAVFTQEDVHKPKAEVLAKRLHQINTQTVVRGIQKQVTSKNIQSLVTHADVVVDGTDSLPIRKLINQTTIEQEIPWAYAGVYGMVGMVLGILPKKTPCLSCISPTLPQPVTEETPVFGVLPRIIASIQATETIKILLGQIPAGLLVYDCWRQSLDQLTMKKNPLCPCCGALKSKP